MYDRILTISSLAEIPSGMLEAARYKRSIKLVRQLHFAIVQPAYDYVTRNGSKMQARGFRGELTRGAVRTNVNVTLKMMLEVNDLFILFLMISVPALL